MKRDGWVWSIGLERREARLLKVDNRNEAPRTDPPSHRTHCASGKMAVSFEELGCDLDDDAKAMGSAKGRRPVKIATRIEYQVG